MNHSNIILTGLPRSGTTLSCHLLNKLDNSVVLNEPVIAIDSIETACQQITAFFEHNRQSILNQKQAMCFHVNDTVPDNIFGQHRNEQGLRIKLQTINREVMTITKNLTTDFTLCIKDNAKFSIVLDKLINDFACYAIIRNPLAVLASWNSVQAPVNTGYINAAEKLEPVLFKKLQAIPDKIDRQLMLLAWFFNQYNSILPKSHIIYYEDIINSSGKALTLIIPSANQLSDPLANKNANELYDKQLMHILAKKLLATDAIYWDFYNKDDVLSLINN
jgi:hypothetical protein